MFVPKQTKLMMKKSFTLLSALVILFAACNKNPANSDVPENKGDTTKILTLVEYDYNNGNIKDSTVKNLTGINGPTGKKFVLTLSYSDSDSDVTVYNLNSQNQLTEISYTYGDVPGEHDRDIFTWSGNNLTKIENEESGKITRAYNFTYLPEGPNTRITYSQIPQKKLDTLFSSGGRIIYSDYNKSAFIVSAADFKPVRIELFSYSYLNNNPANSPEVIRDTINTRFILSAAGDFQQKILVSNAVDSNANEHAGVINYRKDSIVYNYNRDNNDNDGLSAVLKNLLGNQVFVLSAFYSSDFGYNDLVPEMFENYFFINHPLNKETRTSYSWQNEISGGSGVSDDEHILENKYDNQNRLVFSKIVDESHKPIYGFKIMWP
jgi:hypothetical protein